MIDVTEATAATPPTVAGGSVQRPQAELNLLGVAGVALLAGVGLSAAAYASALALLIAVAVVQALIGLGWIFGTGMPGRRGAIVVAALAAAGADVATSLYPDGRLGTLAAVLGLAIPAAFVHQLLRGAARVQLVSSLSAVAVLILAEISVAALLQLRHEFTEAPVIGSSAEGKVTAAVTAAALGAVLVGCLTDLVLPLPRFDAEVPRGILGLVVSAAVGAAIGHLVLRDVHDFAGGRAAFLGAAVGAVAGLLAIAAAFVQHTTPRGSTAPARVGRPFYAALLPVCILAPAAFLLCLAIRA